MCNINSITGNIVDFFNHPFFILVGGISTLLMIIIFLYTIFLAIKGVLPVWYRLGIGLSKRKIAVFASGEYESLKSMLVDSKIFNGKNIIQAHKNALKKAEKATVFLMHWQDYQDCIDDILNIKKDSIALIVYAPLNECLIDPDNLKKLNAHRNTIVVNFRGRLMNDILTSLITTGYEI